MSQHPNTELEELINVYKINAEKILQENRNFLDDLRQGLKVKEGCSQELLILLDELYCEYRDKGPLEKLILIEKVYPACVIINLSQGFDSKEINDVEQLYSAFTLGYFCGELEKAISEIPNNRIAYNIRPVLGLHRF